MSIAAYRLSLIQRALARDDSELVGMRPRYVACAQRLAASLLSNG
jgi:hypothetical protein